MTEKIGNFEWIVSYEQLKPFIYSLYTNGYGRNPISSDITSTSLNINTNTVVRCLTSYTATDITNIGTTL
jgi:hypothetical protein